jgi:hypothetical protein
MFYYFSFASLPANDLLLARPKRKQKCSTLVSAYSFRYAPIADTSRGGSFFAQQYIVGNLFVIFTNFCTLPRQAEAMATKPQCITLFSG